MAASGDLVQWGPGDGLGTPSLWTEAFGDSIVKQLGHHYSHFGCRSVSETPGGPIGDAKWKEKAASKSEKSDPDKKREGGENQGRQSWLYEHAFDPVPAGAFGGCTAFLKDRNTVSYHPLCEQPEVRGQTEVKETHFRRKAEQRETGRVWLDKKKTPWIQISHNTNSMSFHPLPLSLYVEASTPINTSMFIRTARLSTMTEGELAAAHLIKAIYKYLIQ